jgi:hypothetical protein
VSIQNVFIYLHHPQEVILLPYTSAASFIAVMYTAAAERADISFKDSARRSEAFIPVVA